MQNKNKGLILFMYDKPTNLFSKNAFLIFFNILFFIVFSV